MQEIIWRVKPDLIIETGIARGGSLIFYASMMELVGEDGISAWASILTYGRRIAERSKDIPYSRESE